MAGARFFIGFAALAAAVAPATLAGAASSVDEVEARIVQLVNQHRSANGLKALAFDGKLCKAAERHTKDMTRGSYYAHEDPDGGPMAKRIRRYKKARVVGENLGLLTGDKQEGDQAMTVVNAWISSGAHNRNLLSPKFERVCVARGFGELQGRRATFFTQDFSSKK